MNRNDLRLGLLALLREHVDERVPIVPSTTMCGELGLSSVELMALTAEIEDRFGVHLPDSLLPELETVGDMLKAVEVRFQPPKALHG